ncbi:MAG: hypothetical protein GY869_02770, partial [Planctomycetes bacterium]|nr:hypothetical protein [Planctomycetota bacterium]
GTNNALTTNHNCNMPDLVVTSINVACNLDGSITVSGVVTNSGDVIANNVTVDIEMDDGGGFTVVGDNLNTTPADIPAGETATYNFDTDILPIGVEYSFRVTVDPDDTVCECDGTNTSPITSITCNYPVLGIDKSIPQLIRNSVVIPNPATVEPGDVVRYQVAVTNIDTGPNSTSAFNVRIWDELPEPPPIFTYVPDSSTAIWPPTNNRNDNPTGVGSAADPL